MIDKQQIKKRIDHIKKDLNAIARMLDECRAKVYSKDEILHFVDMADYDDFTLKHMYVQDRMTRSVYAAVLDIWDREVIAVTGVRIFYRLSDYGVTWIAWDDVPTKEQIDSVRWPKCTKNLSPVKPNYLFGKDESNG